jgi:prepilin-type N-terminal cleavage/methylation domain-containing protein
MKFAIYKTSGQALKKAGAAVIQNWRSGGGFTLLELMVVIVIIGILASLGYSSFSDIIFANRAKETAHTIRSFTERALMDAKRKGDTVTVEITGNNITATIDGTVVSEALGTGYTSSSTAPVTFKKTPFANKVTSVFRIGLSGVSGKEGYFVACDTRNYCGGAVKLDTVNFFKAYVKKGSRPWEEL